jgi:hypothetical protein
VGSMSRRALGAIIWSVVVGLFGAMSREWEGVERRDA